MVTKAFRRGRRNRRQRVLSPDLFFFSCHFVCFVGELSEAEDSKVNESDNTETEEERVRLKIADLD